MSTLVRNEELYQNLFEVVMTHISQIGRCRKVMTMGSMLMLHLVVFLKVIIIKAVPCSKFSVICLVTEVNFYVLVTCWSLVLFDTAKLTACRHAFIQQYIVCLSLQALVSTGCMLNSWLQLKIVYPTITSLLY